MLWKEYDESQAEQSNSSSSTANSEASATVKNGVSSQQGGGSTEPNNNGTMNGQSHDHSNEMLSANSFYHESDEDISDFSLNDSEDELNAGNYTK